MYSTTVRRRHATGADEDGESPTLQASQVQSPALCARIPPVIFSASLQYQGSEALPIPLPAPPAGVAASTDAA